MTFKPCTENSSQNTPFECAKPFAHPGAAIDFYPSKSDLLLIPVELAAALEPDLAEYTAIPMTIAKIIRMPTTITAITTAIVLVLDLLPGGVLGSSSKFLWWSCQL